MCLFFYIKIMVQKQRIYTLCIILIACFSCIPGWPLCTLPDDNPSDVYIIEGINAATNFDFSTAHENFTQLHNLDNNHPAPYFYFGWLLTRMQDFYMNKDYNDILRYLKYADSLADKKLKQHPNNIEALFYKAASKALVAYIDGLKESWWNAAQAGKSMRSYSKKIIELQPDNPDALYFLGTYDYFSDSLPAAQKFIRTLLLIPGGNKERGLHELQEVSEKGYYTKIEAKRTLLIIYVYFEKDCEHAENIAFNLMEEFPNNPFFRLMLSQCYYMKKEWQQSAKILEDVPDSISYLKKYGYSSLLYEIKYWLARTYLHLEEYQQAETILLTIIQDKPKEPAWLYQWALLSLAQCYDIQGDEKHSMIYYRKALQ